MKLATALTTLLVTTAVASATLRTKGTTYRDSFRPGADWDAGYGIASYVVHDDAGTPGSNADDRLSSRSYLTAWARMMGTKKTMLMIEGNGEHDSRSRSYTLDVDALFLGAYQRIYTKTFTSTVSAAPGFTLPMFTVSQWVTVGPVPVHASATAAVSFGASATGSLTTSGINVTLTPYARAHVDMEAAVDVLFASAGVFGDVTLVKASVPEVAKISRASTCSGFTYSISAPVVITALSGTIGVFATLGGERWEHTFVRIPPALQATFNAIAPDAGTLCL